MTERPEAMTGSPPVDVLSDVLRALRLRTALFFNVMASSPWVAETPSGRELAPHVFPGAEHVIEYHVVMSGSCWGGLLDETPVRLQQGDIIVFPQGDAHVLSSASGMRGAVQLGFYRGLLTQRLPVRVEHGGGGRDGCHLVCGFLACDTRPHNPLLSALPRMIHSKRDAEGQRGTMLEHFMSCALAESETPRAGGEVMLTRLSELMFMEVVRGYVGSVEALESGRSGWLSGLRDEMVGRALGKLHSDPVRAWTIEELAQEVGASRSALAERFADYVGSPPIQYLAQWRMQMAANLLAGPATLAEVAEGVGYGSEAAFSRAFKKIVGLSPAAWRAARVPKRAGAAAGA